MKAFYNCDNHNFPEWIQENASADEIIISGCLSYAELNKIDDALQKVDDILIDVSAFEVGNLLDEADDDLTPLAKIVLNKSYATRYVLGHTYVLSEDGQVYLQRIPVEHIQFPDSVRIIGNYAFASLEQWSSHEVVRIPDGIEIVGDNAFEGTNFDMDSLPDSILEIGTYAFEACDFNKWHIPTGLKVLKEGCFRWIYCLEGDIVVPEGVEKMETEVFSLTNDDKVYLPSTLKEIDDAFFYEYQIDDGEPPYIVVDERNPYFYSKDGSLFKHGSTAPYLGRMYVNRHEEYRKYHYTSVPKEDIGEVIVVPEGITHVEKDAFEDCRNIVRKIVLPQSLVEIAEGAFECCNKLEDVVLPNAIQRIGEGAFSGTKIQRMHIPDSIRSIGKNAFKACKQLCDVRLPLGLRQIPEGLFAFCSSLKIIMLPEALKSIGGCAFEYSGIEEIDIPSGVQEIGDFAFSNTKIRSIAFPEGMKSISARMCNLCGELENVTLPSTIVEIGYMAFADCPKLKRVNGWNKHITQYFAFQGTPLNHHRVLQETGLTKEMLKGMVITLNQLSHGRENRVEYLINLPERLVLHFEGENKRSVLEREYRKCLAELDSENKDRYYYATIISFLERIEQAEDDLPEDILEA